MHIGWERELHMSVRVGGRLIGDGMMGQLLCFLSCVPTHAMIKLVGTMLDHLNGRAVVSPSLSHLNGCTQKSRLVETSHESHLTLTLTDDPQIPHDSPGLALGVMFE